MSTLFCTFFETRTFPLLPSLFFRQPVPSYRLFRLDLPVYRSLLGGLSRRKNYEKSPFRARGVQKNFCFSEISGKFFVIWAANSLLTANYALLFLCPSWNIGVYSRQNRSHPFQRTLPRVRLGMPIHEHTCKNRKTCRRPTAVSWGPYLLPSPQPVKGKFSVNLAIPAAHLPFPTKLHPMRQVQYVSKKAEHSTGSPCLLLYHIILFHIFYMAFFYHNISGIFGHCCTSPGKHAGCIAAQALI